MRGSPRELRVAQEMPHARQDGVSSLLGGCEHPCYGRSELIHRKRRSRIPFPLRRDVVVSEDFLDAVLPHEQGGHLGGCLKLRLRVHVPAMFPGSERVYGFQNIAIG